MSEPKLYEHERLYQARRDAADELYSALSDIMENPLFQTGIGGNPNMVERLIARANAALAKARGEPASAIEAQRAATSGAVHESAVGNAETPTPDLGATQP